MAGLLRNCSWGCVKCIIASDVVKVVVPKGKWAGAYKGRISVEAGSRFRFIPKLEGGPSGAKYADIVKLLDRDGSYEYSERELAAA